MIAATQLVVGQLPGVEEVGDFDAVGATGLDLAFESGEGVANAAWFAVEEEADLGPRKAGVVADALQYLVARDRLYGNIGELQSLPLLHNAYDLFLLSRADPRFSARDPLTNWLRQTLLTGYERWSWAFFDRMSELWTIPHLDDKADSHFEALRRRLGPMSWRELMQFVASEKLSLGELCFVKAHVTGKVISTMLTRAKPFLAADRSAVMQGGIGELHDTTAIKECAAELAGISSNALPLIESIDRRLSRHGVLKADPVWAQTFRGLRDELPRVLDHWNDEGDEFLRGLLKSYPRSQELRSLYASLYAFAKVLESNGSSGNAEKGLANEWWEEDYFLWFVSWSKDAIIEIENFKHPERKDLAPVRGDVRGKLARLGFDAFTKDRGGRG